jgi:ribonuclease P protein component
VKPEQRLRTPADFRRVRDLAPRAFAHPLLVLHFVPNELDHPRVGITVSSRVGKAVIRNRVRRRLREAMRSRFPRLAVGRDVLVTARPASAKASWPELCAALDAVLRRSKVMHA